MPVRFERFDQGLVERVSKSVYMTHCKPPAPVWEKASDDVQHHVRAQARNAIATVVKLQTLGRSSPDELVEAVGRAIYHTHQEFPSWEHTSAQVREFFRAQARSAIPVIETGRR